ncbi:ribonuclease MC-like [Prosopis cineraria]|uniref:ribonuclease MC-like n=1 Tax=Prosopis cineraria TaxID=364024 RepID=UPI00240EC22A|nr:ribonuclease MC-like [Prosopis cineraria]XP_054793887.1 ribonuclease MC-like [Prosopis cineraria]
MRISSKQVLVFIVPLILAWLCLYYFNYNTTKKNTNLFSAVQLKPGFDYFLLALQWPNTFCKTQPMGKPPCNPNPPTQQDFTIHGLWPQFNSGKAPANCRPAPDMTPDDLRKFEQDLLAYWPDLHDANDFDKSMRFWQYEWNKHGTCSSNKFSTQQYLKITIDLAKNYAQPILSKMRAAGINPDAATPHDETNIQNAVKDATGQSLLQEIRLCVEDDGVTLFDCNTASLFADDL